MDIRDPNDKAVLGGQGERFTFPLVTIEDVHMVDDRHIIVGNANNYGVPMGRQLGEQDHNEFILLETPELLQQAVENERLKITKAGAGRGSRPLSSCLVMAHPCGPSVSACLPARLRDGCPWTSSGRPRRDELTGCSRTWTVSSCLRGRSRAGVSKGL